VILFRAPSTLLDPGIGHRNRQARFSSRLLEAFMREHARRPVDLFFAYLFDHMVDPQVIDEIRRRGVPTCNFSCNNVHQFHLVDGLAPHFDYSLHAERAVRDKFLAIGANPIWWQMGSNPKYFRPCDMKRTIPVSFAGANYALRAKYIAHLLRAGVNVHAYGPAWVHGSSTQLRAVLKRYVLAFKSLATPSVEERRKASCALADHDERRSLSKLFPSQVHPAVTDEGIVQLYSRSHISLGFLEVYDRHEAGAPVLKHLHLREFEAPMCGALYCTGYSDELAEFFVPDREVIVYRDPDELLDKVRHYLANAEAGERIRRAGHQRALRDHTSHERFKSLFRTIGLERRASASVLVETKHDSF
jgi:spore maturation protein CgeB